MILIYYLIFVNVFAFYLYWNDKRRARKGRWRIPENTLLLVTLIGGSVGALFGMYVIRHKTQHWKFKILVPLCLGLHIAIYLFLIMK